MKTTVATNTNIANEFLVCVDRRLFRLSGLSITFMIAQAHSPHLFVFVSYRCNIVCRPSIVNTLRYLNALLQLCCYVSKISASAENERKRKDEKCDHVRCALLRILRHVCFTAYQNRTHI